MRRSDSFDQRFSKEIKSPKYARVFIGELLFNKDEPMELVDVLRIIAQKMGNKEFAEFVKERPQNIIKFVNGSRSPKRETLDKYLKPFGLTTTLTVKELVRKAS